MENIVVMLRPKTGSCSYKMDCEFYKDEFVLTMRRRAIFDSDAGKQFHIPYKSIASLENNPYCWVSGIKINLTDKNVDFPSSPPKALGGLIGAFISMARSKLFILYFNKKIEMEKFVAICKENNPEIKFYD